MTAENPELLSQRELDDYLDKMSDAGMTDTPEFERAYAVWEARS